MPRGPGPPLPQSRNSTHVLFSKPKPQNHFATSRQPLSASVGLFCTVALLLSLRAAAQALCQGANLCTCGTNRPPQQPSCLAVFDDKDAPSGSFQLSCTGGGTVVIQSAAYRKAHNSHYAAPYCSEGPADALSRLQDICNSKSSCSINTSLKQFFGRHCRNGVRMQLRVEYTCATQDSVWVPADPRPLAVGGGGTWSLDVSVGELPYGHLTPNAWSFATEGGAAPQPAKVLGPNGTVCCLRDLAVGVACRGAVPFA